MSAKELFKQLSWKDWLSPEYYHILLRGGAKVARKIGYPETAEQIERDADAAEKRNA